MSEKRRGLGRGLGALIPSGTAQVTRPVGDRPVDVFFPGRGEGDDLDGLMDGLPPERPGDASGPGGQPSPLTVLPGGRLAPVGTGAVPVGYRAPVAPQAPGPVQGVPQPAPASPTALVGVPGALETPSARLGSPVAPVTAPPPYGAMPSPAPAQVEPPAAPTGPTGLAEPPADAGAVPADGLIPVPGATFAELPVDAVRPNPRQPRQVFDDDELAELVESVKVVGILQPVVVRRVADEDGEPRFELIMGERRLRACRDAGLERIPAIVRDTQDDALLRDALLENLHRSQLNALEEAAAYQQLLDDFGCTHEELADRIGRSRSQISNTLRLLRLPALVQKRVAAGVLSAGHARALLGLEDPAAMERLAQRIVNEGLSVRSVEEIVRLDEGSASKPARKRPRAGTHTSELDDLAARLGDQLDTRVAIALGRNKGRLSIEFASVDDLNRIIAILGPEVRGFRPR